MKNDWGIWEVDPKGDHNDKTLRHANGTVIFLQFSEKRYFTRYDFKEEIKLMRAQLYNLDYELNDLEQETIYKFVMYSEHFKSEHEKAKEKYEAALKNRTEYFSNLCPNNKK